MITVDSPKSIKINGTEYSCLEDYNDIYDALKKGETVLHWESGNSLFPIIKKYGIL